ncbi:MAG: SusC/RagA family TonB-linked outer membrane protein, partial [Chitinophagales bacterium]
MRNLSIFLLLIFGFAATAQSQMVSGRITNAKGEPVSFATVKVKGSKTSVAADVDGSFKIKAATGQTLLITSTNYSPMEVLVQNESNLAVTMHVQESALSEVVVTSLGVSRSKAKVGYSTSTFNNEAINRASPISMLDGLQGKIAGADISTVSGTPGGSTKVVLRGYGVIGGGNNQPLYVIDGIPLSDASFTVAATGGNGPALSDYGNGMNDINPSDIESLTVLKGTAASSLYGSQAKNGVVLITTKKGRAGKVKIDFSSTFNESVVGKLPDFEKKFGQGWGGTFILSENGSWGPELDGKMRPWGSIVDNSQLIKTFSYRDGIRDFFDKGTELNNTIAVSGGNERTNYYFSYGNVFSDGILPGKSDYLQRHTLSLRTNSSYDNFSISTSLNYINRNLNTPAKFGLSPFGSDIYTQLWQIPVDIPIRDFMDYKNKFFNVDNFYSPYTENPYYTLNENGSNQISDRLFGKIDMTYKFSNYLSAQLRVGGDFTNAHTKIWNAVNAPSPGSWNAGGNVEGQSRRPDIGSYQEQTDRTSIINGDFIVRYTKDLDKDFNLDVLVGSNYYQTQASNLTAAIQGLTVPYFYNLSNSNNPPTSSNGYAEKRLIGVYGQAVLGYKEQLYLTINARNDWSSTLPIDHNSFFYPGANLSWIASQTFDLSNSMISLLKFRAAYGKTGADAQPYLIYPTLTQGNIQNTSPPISGMLYGTVTFPFNGVNGFTISNNIGNLNLKPIITKEAEFGTEIRLFQNRFGLDAAYYDKETDGQIFTVPIAPSTGYTGLVENIGVVSNKGIELTVDVTPVKTTNFNWKFYYTFAKNWNQVVRLTAGLDKVIEATDGLSGGIEFDAVPGKPIGSYYSPVPLYSPDGKIVVDPNTAFPVQAPDKADIGTSQRDFTMGLVNMISYKNWTLGFSLDYRKGGMMYSGTADLVMFSGNGIATAYNDRRPFIIPNSVNQVIDNSGKATYTENKTYIDESNIANYFYTNNNKPLAYPMRLIDKSFLKLRDVTLTYSIPKAWAAKIKANNLSLTAYGRNIFLWTPKSNSYVDPEVSNLGNDLVSEFGEYGGGVG